MIVTDMKSAGDGGGNMQPDIMKTAAIDREPPPYTGPIASSSTLPPPARIPPPQNHSYPSAQNAPASNFIFVQRKNETLKGTYVIDPTITIPEGMLPLLKRKQERKNLHLDTHNGNIKADVFLLGNGSTVPAQYYILSPKKKPTTVDITTGNGLVTMKMNCDKSHPFILSISVRKGSISLALPRDFRGSLTLRTKKGWINFSPAFGANISPSSEAKGKRVYVMRESHYNNDAMSNPPSSVELRIRSGLVKLCYCDEMPDANQASEKAGFWARLFGLSDE